MKSVYALVMVLLVLLLAPAPSAQSHVEPTGATADRFVQQPATVQVYVDGRLAHEVRARGKTMRLDVPLARLSAGPHVVAVNWGSTHGPLAANAFVLNR